MDDLFEITDSTFDDEIIENDGKLKLVYFYFSWLTDCMDDLEMLSEIIEKYKGKVKFYKINADQAPKISSRFSIRTEPSAIIFHEGDDLERFDGDINTAEIEIELNNFIKNLNKTKKEIDKELSESMLKEIKSSKKKGKVDEKKNNNRRKLENEPKLRRRNKISIRNKK